MNKEDASVKIKSAILQLEKQKAEESKLLKEQFHLAYESIKPINLIKSTIKEVSGTPGLKDHIINTAVGLTVGYFSKMLFVGFSKNPMKRLLGNALMIGITNAVVKNPETIKAMGITVFRMIRNRVSAKSRIE